MGKQEYPRGIRPRGEKWFVDVTVNGKRKTATVDTFDEAVEKKHSLTEALKTGKEVTQRRSNAKSWTLQQALDKTLSLPKPAGWKGISYEKQATLNAQSAVSYWGPDRCLDTLSLEDMDAWLTSCEATGNSNATVNRKLSALSKMMTVAVDYGGLEVMPRMPKQRKERVGRIRFITDAEEKAIEKWCLLFGETNDFWGVIQVLIDTGMRRSELLNLRPADVDMKTGVIMVYGKEDEGTKNGGIRSVPMTSRVRNVMSRHCIGSRCFDMSESYLRHTWDKMRDHLGLSEDRDFVLHVCRHTCASRLVKAGVSLPVVKQWMGHKNIQTTMRYAHLFPQDLMLAAKALEGSDQ